MESSYFILTTANVVDGHFTAAVEDSGTERTNDDGTKTLLEVIDFDAADTEHAFYGETPCTHVEILSLLTAAEWQ